MEEKRKEKEKERKKERERESTKKNGNCTLDSPKAQVLVVDVVY